MMTFSPVNPARLWCAALIALAAPPVGAYDTGSIGVFSDPSAGSCNITDVAAIVNVEVVLVNSAGATHVSFAVEEADGVRMTYAAETIHFNLKLGDTREGIQITFAACRTGTVHLATLRYSGTGTTTACEEIRVVPHPDVGSVRIYDCEQNPYTTPGGGFAFVRNDGACGCDVATEESTWGRIKSLYR